MNREKIIRDLTEECWADKWQPTKYIQRLLPEELNWLKDHDKIPSPSEILVQLVGYTWNPLLISTCAYKPDILILVLNEYYGLQEGASRGDEYKELLKALLEQKLIEKLPTIIPQPWEITTDKPEAVFHFLQKHTLPFINAGRQVVIDITGGKKSMGSGAYLFSSYTNASVAYIDYDEYNVEEGQPYGYKCKPGALNNPMELFKLREWYTVQQLYENYAFKSAKLLVEDIETNLKAYFTENDQESIKVLKEWLEFYRLWDDGDYKGAWELTQQKDRVLSEIIPSAVICLHAIWPNKNNLTDLKNGVKVLEGLNEINNSIYSKDKEILIYSYDELEKIKRLIRHEDYRSVLLRAAGLNELLLRARLLRLWMQNEFVIECKGKIFTRNNFSGDQLAEIDKNLLEAGATYLIRALRWEDTKKKQNYVIELYKMKKFDIIPIAHRKTGGIILTKFWKSVKPPIGFELPDDIFEFRNKAIHFCLSVPFEIAECVTNVAEANIKDFENNWIGNISLTDMKCSAVEWDKLLKICELNFLSRR